MVAVRRSGTMYGQGDGEILLDDLDCSGTESSLLQCQKRGGMHDCNHTEDAGVRCGGNVKYGVGSVMA